LPFSEDGEKGVLCSLLLSPRTVLDFYQIKLRPEAFYGPAHQTVYIVVAELVDANKPIDFITLKQALKDRGQLDEVGGPEYLNDLFSFVPTAANAEYYIKIIREKYILRQMILTCGRVITQCYDNSEEVDSLLDTVEQQIFSITGSNSQIDMRATKEIVMQAIEEIEQLYENRGAITGLPTGFIELDRMTVKAQAPAFKPGVPLFSLNLR
jgi:replicative DNA helicase